MAKLGYRQCVSVGARSFSYTIGGDEWTSSTSSRDKQSADAWVIFLRTNGILPGRVCHRLAVDVDGAFLGGEVFFSCCWRTRRKPRTYFLSKYRGERQLRSKAAPSVCLPYLCGLIGRQESCFLTALLVNRGCLTCRLLHPVGGGTAECDCVS
jgi:hypothetical protein